MNEEAETKVEESQKAKKKREQGGRRRKEKEKTRGNGDEGWMDYIETRNKRKGVEEGRRTEGETKRNKKKHRNLKSKERKTSGREIEEE